MSYYPKKSRRYSASNHGVKTRSQTRVDTQNSLYTKINKMAETKPDLANILTLISVFDGKRDKNAKFYLSQFDTLTDSIELTDALKLNILKAKFMGEAREKLASDEKLNSEADYKAFKTKVIEIFGKKESFADSQDKFNQLKQKPSQKIVDFIKEFNAASIAYLNASGHAGDEGAQNFFDLIKVNKFLEAISPSVALELKKLGLNYFGKICEKA